VRTYIGVIFAGISLSQIGTIVSIFAGLVAILAAAPAAIRTVRAAIDWIRKRKTPGD
jgi:hypothetical protein